VCMQAGFVSFLRRLCRKIPISHLQNLLDLRKSALKPRLTQRRKMA
jgi:hypothetical protein